MHNEYFTIVMEDKSIFTIIKNMQFTTFFFFFYDIEFRYYEKQVNMKSKSQSGKNQSSQIRVAMWSCSYAFIL